MPRISSLRFSLASGRVFFMIGLLIDYARELLAWLSRVIIDIIVPFTAFGS